MAKKSIKISVDTGRALPLSYLEDFQGELKTLDPENHKKLENSILDNGFCFPIFVWENPEDGKIKIIDGHQRVKVLNSLKKKKYTIPQIPVVMIPADNEKEAKGKLLSAASNFGKFNDQGFSKFTEGLDLKNLFKKIEIPLMNVSDILEKSTIVSSHERELNNTSKEVDLSDYEDFEHKCPKCGFEWNK